MDISSKTEVKLFPTPGTNCVSGVDLEMVTIHNSSIPVPNRPSNRFKISQVSLKRCKHYACYVHGAILENVTVDCLTGGKGVPTFLKSCIYSNVIVKGRISGIHFRWMLDFENLRKNKAFVNDAKKFYRDVDTALDISEAKFSFFQSIEGVPAKEIRRNPESQFILRREAANIMRGKMERYDTWSLSADNLLTSGFEDTVVVVPSTGRNAKRDLSFAHDLKKEGLIS